MARWLLGLLAGVGASVAATAEDPAPTPPALAEALAGRVAGKPRNCIALSPGDGPEVIDSRTILYRQSGARVWLNRLEQACPALREEDIVVVESYGGQLCRLDRFQVVGRNGGVPSAFCFFGAFTPYDSPKPAQRR